MQDRTWAALNREIESKVKEYLGYKPYYDDNPNCRDAKYAKYLEARYGKDIQGLMDQVGLKDHGPTVRPARRAFPDQSAQMRALKKIYEIQDLYFYKRGGYKIFCSLRPPEDRRVGTVDYYELKRSMERLSGEKRGFRNLDNAVMFEDTGNQHQTLDSLREEMFIVKLSGLA